MRGFGDGTELQHIDPHSFGHKRVFFPFSWAAQPGAWGPASLCAGFLYRILSPTRMISNSQSGAWGLPLLGAGFLYRILSPTDWISCALSYIIIQRQSSSCGRHKLHSFILSTVKVILCYSSTGGTCYLHRCISYFDSPAGVLTSLLPSHLSSSLTDSLPSLNLLCHSKTDARFMEDCSKALWSIPYVSVVLFPSLKHNFIAYRSSKVSDCIFEIPQLWQPGFSRVYSTYCCSCSFEPEIIKIGQSSHRMYSNNTLNCQESTTILNTCTKKSGNSLNAPRNFSPGKFDVYKALLLKKNQIFKFKSLQDNAPGITIFDGNIYDLF